MSKAIVTSQRGNFEFAFGLLRQFMHVCPDATWNKKFGGWPIWQQVYHALNAVEFFIAEPGAESSGALVPPDVASLSVVGDAPISKAAMAAFADKAKAAADKYMDALADADLAARAEGASARMGRETTHASIVVLMAGHILYHLGTCDAALREQGLKGVF